VKALKNLGYALVLGVLALALVGLYLPGDVAVERRLTVAATPERLFPLLEGAQSLARWSPWLIPGPGQQRTFDGPASGVGLSLRWEGGTFPMVSGSYEITEVDARRRVGLRLQLPFLGKTHSTLALYPAATPGETEVVWRLYDQVGFNLVRRLLWLAADPLLGPQLERGLENLRTLAGYR
jgi:uncharacterized protein YndB with AHSA1/START domain